MFGGETLDGNKAHRFPVEIPGLEPDTQDQQIISSKEARTYRAGFAVVLLTCAAPDSGAVIIVRALVVGQRPETIRAERL